MLHNLTPEEHDARLIVAARCIHPHDWGAISNLQKCALTDAGERKLNDMVRAAVSIENASCSDPHDHSIH